MVRISVQAAHEQVNPIDLLDDAVNMEHFPWLWVCPVLELSRHLAAGSSTPIFFP